MNLGCAGASEAQERVQNLAHGHPRGLGCSLTMVVLSLVHAGSFGGSGVYSINAKSQFMPLSGGVSQLGLGWHASRFP